MSYLPKPGEIAGFELIGYRQKDKSIKLGNENGTPMQTFPDEVVVNGMTYTLEEITKNPNSIIEWGVYV